MIDKLKSLREAGIAVLMGARPYPAGTDTGPERSVVETWRIKQLAEELRKVNAVTGRGGWLPIETASKDGGEMLLFCPAGIQCEDRAEGMTSSIVVGTWRGRPYGSGGHWICDVMEIDMGYYVGDFSRTALEITPSHWQPLPAAPRHRTECQP